MTTQDDDDDDADVVEEDDDEYEYDASQQVSHMENVQENKACERLNQRVFICRVTVTKMY